MIIITALILLSLSGGITPATFTCNYKASCGCSKRSSVALWRIIGGEPVDTSLSWGWIASLRRNGSHICGASLVSDRYVITAAHCIQPHEPISILTLHFGTTKLSSTGQTRTVAQVNIHPLYDPDSFMNDLAVLRLNESLNLTNQAISCICLPPKDAFDDQSLEYPSIGQSLVAIGWGVTDPASDISSPTLQQVTVQALPRTDPNCASSINDEIVQFCAGVPGSEKDTCRGDSGGPLMMFVERQWQLVGVTSYGPGCALEGFSGIYTRIAYYHSYIEQIINSNHTNSSTTSAANIGQSSPNVEHHSNTGSSNRILAFLIYLDFILILYTHLFRTN